MNLLKKLWRDEKGYILSAEAALIGTLGAVGATVGLGAVSQSVNDELTEVAYAFRSLDQSYQVEGTTGCGACTAASGYTQQDVKSSHAELADWIAQHRAGADGQADSTTAANVAPPLPAEETKAAESLESMNQRLRDDDTLRKKKSDDKPKKKRKKKKKHKKQDKD